MSDDQPVNATPAERERDLYLRILNLGLQDDLDPFLHEALEIITRALDADQGYIEVEGGSDDSSPCWWAAHGLSGEEVETVRQSISRGIVAEALSSGETIATRSALDDERFKGRQSVRDARVQAVVCAPIGPQPLGVVYLHRRGPSGEFSEKERARVEDFAKHLAPYADRLRARQVMSERTDPTLDFRRRLRIDRVIGRSVALAHVLREVALVAPLDVDVLITGESGTGKSQIARVIHENSPRAAQSFVELNCAAIPESLIESELFGAVQGAHSTAVRRAEGKVGAAQRGTLLLDEVGELTPSAQAKLLQLLQSRSYYPLGSPRLVKADLRVVAATNIDLQGAVAAGKFREDLFYRLNVLPIRMPSLSERRDDIGDLARFFCDAAIQRHRLVRVSLSGHLLDALRDAEWPGNIRQLANMIEAAVIRTAGSGMLRVERAHVFPSLSPVVATAESGIRRGAARPTFQEATRRFQAELLRETLEDNGWSIADASRQLEIARSHTYALIRAFGIERDGRTVEPPDDR